MPHYSGFWWYVITLFFLAGGPFACVLLVIRTIEDSFEDGPA